MKPTSAFAALTTIASHAPYSPYYGRRMYRFDEPHKSRKARARYKQKRSDYHARRRRIAQLVICSAQAQQRALEKTWGEFAKGIQLHKDATAALEWNGQAGQLAMFPNGI